MIQKRFFMVIKKYTSCLFIFFALSGHLFASDDSTKDIVDVYQLIDKWGIILNEHSLHTYHNILILSSIIGIVTFCLPLLLSVVLWLSEKRRRQSDIERKEILEQELSFMQKQSQFLKREIDNVKKEVKSEIFKDQQINAIKILFENKLNQYDYEIKTRDETFKYSLQSMVNNMLEPIIEKRIRKSTIKWELSSKLSIPLKNAIEDDNVKSLLILLNEWSKYNYAIAQILSGKRDTIKTGLGELIGSVSREYISPQVWETLKYLNSIGELPGPEFYNLISKLGIKISKKPNEIFNDK